MNAQQLAGDDDEQSSGYRCSGSSAGVQKCARVRACERRLLPGVACVQALVHEQELVSDMGKTTTEAARVVFRGCCACSASVLRVRARTERVERVRECAGAAR